jgi:DNA-binding NarL/FixJ family response regulator
VDDHPCLLQGLTVVFRDAADTELLGTAADAAGALESAAAHQPDVVILEVRLPDASGVETVARLREASPASSAVMYSAVGDRRLLTDAIAAGARGYVLKSSPASDLLRAVRTIAAGRPYVDPVLSPTLLMDPAAPEAPLPERERQILQLLAEGLGTEEVAERVGLSAETVKADTRRAIYRLEATGRVHAVANAMRRAHIA